MQVLGEAVWRARQAAHEARADALTAGRRARAARGERHPVEDFLWTYYSISPGRLRQWHPGADVALVGEEARRWYRAVRTDDGPAVALDVPAFLADRGDAVRFVTGLLAATASRPARLGCFGLHEWAMVYRQGEERRHADRPLRLGPAGTDAVVEANPLRCSHFDAFRFFTEPARPRNAVQPTRAAQVALEQPGCLHATMDLYKWAGKLGPLVPTSLVLDCLELARDARALDMRASPYDLADLGYEPVRVETAAGRQQYAAAQRGLADRGQVLRAALLGVLEPALVTASA